MNNPTTYIEKLDKSMTRKEKLFFLNKINWKEYGCVIDFGGANGRLLWEVDKYLTKHHLDKGKRIRLINVEKNDQLGTAYEYKRDYYRYPYMLNAWLTAGKYGMGKGRKILFVFSSVLHELDRETLDELTRNLTNLNATVVVRDMFWQNDNNKSFNWDRYLFKVGYHDRKRFEDVKSRYDTHSFWFPYEQEKLWYEFLLKWNYLDNWATEVKENYFNEHAHNFIVHLAVKGKVKYKKCYVLPYKKREVCKKFGFKMKKTTHIKLIVELKRGQ